MDQGKTETQTRHSNEQLKQVDYWVQINLANKRLHKKFGPLLTEWEPTPSNIHLLNNEEFLAKVEDLAPGESTAKFGPSNAFAWTHHPTRQILFNLDKFQGDMVTFRHYSAHEMIHAHTLTHEVFKETMTPGLTGREYTSQWIYYTGGMETVTEYLATKTVGYQNKDLGALPQKMIGVTTDSMVIAEILEPLGEGIDLEVFKVLEGQHSTKLENGLNKYYGPDFYRKRFIPFILGMGVLDKVWGKEFEDICLARFAEMVREVQKRKPKCIYLQRSDFKSATHYAF